MSTSQHQVSHPVLATVPHKLDLGRQFRSLDQLHKAMPPTTINVPYPPPSPLSASLRNDITSALFSQTEAIPTLQKTLLAACEKEGWLDAVRERSLQLLREDEGRGYREVMAILVDEARGQGEGGKSTGDAAKKGEARVGRREVVDVKMPERAVNEGARVVRDALEGIVEVEGNPR